jgi:hypothetical protein
MAGMGSYVAATKAGRVEGAQIADGVVGWSGIPYAAPPLGELRLRAPEPAAAWTGVRAATSYGAPSLQPPSDFPPAASARLGALGFLAVDGEEHSGAFGLPDWPGYETSRRTTLIFDNPEPRLAEDPNGAQRAAWDGREWPSGNLVALRRRVLRTAVQVYSARGRRSGADKPRRRPPAAVDQVWIRPLCQRREYQPVPTPSRCRARQQRPAYIRLVGSNQTFVAVPLPWMKNAMANSSAAMAPMRVTPSDRCDRVRTMPHAPGTDFHALIRSECVHQRIEQACVYFAPDRAQGSAGHSHSAGAD